MKKKVLKVCIVIFVILAVIGLFCYHGLRQYFDNNTWATVTVNGTSDGETADTYYDDQECLKGDRISISTLTLEVTNVEHDGTLSFTVKSGELKDESGNKIQKDVLEKGVMKSYKSGSDSFTLCVTSNRYR